jgi:hypothetical protein
MQMTLEKLLMKKLELELVKSPNKEVVHLLDIGEVQQQKKLLLFKKMNQSHGLQLDQESFLKSKELRQPK